MAAASGGCCREAQRCREARRGQEAAISRDRPDPAGYRARDDGRYEDGDDMKRYKYRALVTLEPQGGDRPGVELPGTGCRMAVRARHHETHRSKLFSAVVTTSDGSPLQAGGQINHLTMTVLGDDDTADYLQAGDGFALCRGRDIGHGVISRRLVLWIESP